jgi:hypothetical protein
MTATFTKNLALGAILLGAAATLSACGKKDASADTNVVEMNAMDGSMNDMTTVDSATLDAAGSANIGDAAANVGDNAANAQ